MKKKFTQKQIEKTAESIGSFIGSAAIIGIAYAGFRCLWNVGSAAKSQQIAMNQSTEVMQSMAEIATNTYEELYN